MFALDGGGDGDAFSETVVFLSYTAIHRRGEKSVAL